MKFSPETYQTRCGRPWRLLDVRSGHMVIAVYVSEECDLVRWVCERGQAYLQNGTREDQYDLIPIPVDPQLPVEGLAGWVNYAAMDGDDYDVYLFSEKVEYDPSEEQWYSAGVKLEELPRGIFPEALAAYKGRAEDSLHKLDREKKAWVKVD